MERTGRARTQASALKSHKNIVGHSGVFSFRMPQKVASCGKLESVKMLEAFVSKVLQPQLPVVKKGLFFPPHADDLLACCVMWHFITKMDSHIPQGFSGFLPEILTAFCQFMVPTSHFSTVAERRETRNSGCGALSLSSHFLYCTPSESPCLMGQA